MTKSRSKSKDQQIEADINRPVRLNAKTFWVLIGKPMTTTFSDDEQLAVTTAVERMLKDQLIMKGYLMGMEAAAMKCEDWSRQSDGVEVLDNVAQAIRRIDPMKGY